MERLDKILASQGVGTRSEVRKMIWSGKVTVDGAVCRSIDRKLESSAHDIAVSGRSVCLPAHLPDTRQLSRATPARSSA